MLQMWLKIKKKTLARRERGKDRSINRYAVKTMQRDLVIQTHLEWCNNGWSRVWQVGVMGEAKFGVAITKTSIK